MPSAVTDETKAEFANGEGTEENPFMIQTLDQLDDVRNNLDANYELGNDIDASDTSGWNNAEGFVPIGDDDSPFTGTFDGKGHNITGLHIDRPDESVVGMFGLIGDEGKVHDLRLEDLSINGIILLVD